MAALKEGRRRVRRREKGDTQTLKLDDRDKN